MLYIHIQYISYLFRASRSERRVSPCRLPWKLTLEVTTLVSSNTARPARPLASTETSFNSASTLFLAKMPSKGPGMASSFKEDARFSRSTCYLANMRYGIYIYT